MHRTPRPLASCWRIDVKITRSALAGTALVLSSLIWTTPAAAGWKEREARARVEVDSFSVTPDTPWNQASRRPGKQARAWTQDGFALNKIEFFSGIPKGGSFYKERSKKRNPMPKFDPSVLLPELAGYFERSFRAQYQVTDFTIVESRASVLAGQRALQVTYRYSLPNDELTRMGEVRLTVVDGKLYAMNFYAPELHYFEAGLPEVEDMMEGASLQD
jgi:hypothetical protein